MDEEIKLLPCPFCGNIPQQLTMGDGEQNWTVVNCTRCLFDFDGSVELWNTRAGLDLLRQFNSLFATHFTEGKPIKDLISEDDLLELLRKTRQALDAD